MKSSLGDGQDPLVKTIWQVLLKGIRELLDQALALLSGAEVLDGGLLLRLEKAVHALAGKLICDPLVGFAIESALGSDGLEKQARDLVSRRPYARLQDSDEMVRIRLLGGTLQEFVAPYYLIRKPRGRGRPTNKRGVNGNGFYPSLELLGIFGRVTPAVASVVASQLVRSPVDEATLILEDQGLKLDSKTVTRVGYEIGNRALEFRTSLLGRMNAGQKGALCKGKRIVVEVDGARVRTRVPDGRKRSSTGRRRFKGEWREPKVFVVYEIDEKGKKKRKGLYFYGGTMGQADECFDLLAAYLCHIGAHEADEVVMAGDGAEWIWNRVEALLEKTGIDPRKVTEVVDFYHALERLHDVAKTEASWTERQRKQWVSARVTQLRCGHLAAMQKACNELDPGLSNYFCKNASRLNYRLCRLKCIPMGSGAVESGIRRIINLRLKGNGIFWGIENAEALINLRCQLLAGRWFKLMESVILPREHWERCAA